jgi:hypothetical protein
LTRFTAVVFSLRSAQYMTRTESELYTPETILKPAGHVLEVLHAARAGSLSALGLLAPLIRPQFGGRVSALRACCKTASIKNVIII